MDAAGAGLLLWLAFGVSWALAAPWAGRAAERAGSRRSMLYLVGFAIGFGLLFPSPRLAHALVFAGRDGGAPWRWIVLGAEAAGFAFAWWARLRLGRLWSGLMTLREGHRVVDSGPYAIVRHPIYTGLIASAWALALILGGVASLTGAAVLTCIMAGKARAEEALLRRALGAVAYDGYAARVPMLLPFTRFAARRP